MLDVERAPELARVSARRTAELLAALGALHEPDFAAPSALPGWSRLTILCHLRYGATALLRMTGDVLDGRATAYYPEGRAGQRPGTLAPRPGERPADVLNDWAATAGRLDAVWAAVDVEGWAATVTEPAGNPDLGAIPFARLALARLTEVDVHGVDLDIGMSEWSDTLVDVALPTRLSWLATRRVNHRDFDRSISGTWRLASEDGFGWLVTVDGDHVASSPAEASAGVARASITGTRRDLLALLLGRPATNSLTIGGDVAFGAAFSRAFPGP